MTSGIGLPAWQVRRRAVTLRWMKAPGAPALMTLLALCASATVLARSPALWSPDLGNGDYRNPVIFADYSDPDVIRVGDEFYLTASSFNCAPGLPILHSKDLVNWTIIGHALPRFNYGNFDVPQHGNGVWAPSLRFHNGQFYIYYGDPDFGIFMTQTTNPAGPWQPLVCVRPARGWIDCCPFWDDDGSAYLVHAFAASRAGFANVLHLNRMSPDGASLLDDGKLIIDGHAAGLTTLEGAKLYKRGDCYYILAPAGGVTGGYQMAFRSKNIYGPYEAKKVLAQGTTPINGPHQGGWVELKSGESWFLHFQDRGPYGRVTHLEPVQWVQDWPLMGTDQDGQGLGQPVLTFKKPDVGRPWPVTVPQTSDEFDSSDLGLQWQWQANPKDQWFSLTARPGWLRLNAVPMPAGCHQPLARSPTSSSKNSRPNNSSSPPGWTYPICPMGTTPDLSSWAWIIRILPSKKQPPAAVWPGSSAATRIPGAETMKNHPLTRLATSSASARESLPAPPVNLPTAWTAGNSGPRAGHSKRAPAAGSEPKSASSLFPNLPTIHPAAPILIGLGLKFLEPYSSVARPSNPPRKTSTSPATARLLAGDCQ